MSKLDLAARDAVVFLRKAGGAGVRHAAAVEALIGRKHRGREVSFAGTLVAFAGALIFDYGQGHHLLGVGVSLLGLAISLAGLLAKEKP